MHFWGGEERQGEEAIFCGLCCFTNSSCRHCSLKAVSEADEVTHTLSLSLCFPHSLLCHSCANAHARALSDTLTHVKLVVLKISAHTATFT